MSDVITEAADTLQGFLDGLTATFTANGTSHTSTLKAHLWGPRQFDSLPAVVIELPAIERVGLDEPESQLGTRDFRLFFPVTLYFDVSEAAYTQAQAIAMIAEVIDAIDADPGLGDPTVIDTKVENVDRPELEPDASRVRLRYPATVAVLKLVP